MLILWLSEWRMLYFAAFCVLLGLSLIWSLDATEQSIRLVGLALQVLGIGTVIWGISVTRKQFGHPPVVRLLASWLRRCPLVRRPAYLQPEGISVGASIVGMRLTEVFTPNPSAPLGDRLVCIEKGLETLQKRIDSAESQIDNESSVAHGKVLVESRARVAADKDIMGALEASSTGGISISAVGALWLFVGVILSTASQELAAWLV